MDPKTALSVFCVGASVSERASRFQRPRPACLVSVAETLSALPAGLKGVYAVHLHE
jgi:hypothetical protein